MRPDVSIRTMLRRYSVSGAGAPALSAPADYAKAYRHLTEKVLAAKTALDPFSPAVFTRVASAADLYAPLKQTVKKRDRTGKVTNAWLKMAEMWDEYRLAQLPRSGGDGAPLRVLFNGELPGAFISAVRHYARKTGVELEWCASSLYPDTAPGSRGEGALGDRQIIAQHRDRWLMDGAGANADDRWPGADGPPNDGDMGDPDKAAGIAARARALLGGGADLYTSDIGIGVDTDYGRQEELNLRPHLGQALCGLLALAPGGVLIVKMYTLYTPLARSLVGVLAAHFDRLELCKPVTSRPTNSEVYIVGLGFAPPSPDYKEKLQAAFALMRALPPEASLEGYGPENVPPAVQSALYSASAELARSQIRALAGLTRLLYIYHRDAWVAEQSLLKSAGQKERARWLARHAP